MTTTPPAPPPTRRRAALRLAVATATLAATLAATLTVPVQARAATAPAPSASGTASASRASSARGRLPVGRHQADRTPQLPAPPRPPAGRPRQPSSPTATPTGTATGTGTAAASARVTGAGTVAAAVATPSTARTFGPAGPATTLVLYDTTGAYGWLGELYALAGGTLATHFGQVTAEPVSSYVAGQVEGYTATLYFGSTYNEVLPAAFLADVRSTAKPVLWSGFNVWQLSGAAGSSTATAFQARYGWDPSTSYLDATDTLQSVSYRGRSLTRNALNTGGVLAPHVTNASLVNVLAQATCTTGGVPVACDGIAQTTGSTLPWAIRSANLTYVGEIPFSYLSERDRYLAFADLLYPALAPSTAPSKKAAVRLEDVSPKSDPAVLRQFADYLSAQGVPFQVAVIPQYTDPKGTFNGGVAQRITLAQAPTVVSALKYLQSKGGTIVQHGYTHQYSTVANPYNAVTADDFEFFRAECSSTAGAPYAFGACQDSSWVIQEGPLPGDSTAWAAGRALTGRTLFALAGLGAPTIFETPHYSASAADYRGIRTVYATRYERELLFGGLLKPGNSAANRFGQFFPYSVTDVYGSKVLPENLGNYEPALYNNNPPRTAQDIVDNAAANQVVTQATASLFFHPDYPLAQLQSVVTGIKGLGYTFVAAGSLS